MTRDHRRLAAIVSIDVVGYSRLMGVDESGTLSALKDHRRSLIDPKIAEHDGRIVKTTGDGVLLEFPSVVDAVRCAVEIQRGMAERNAAIAVDERLDFRIGINVGDIIIDGDDIFGDGVNIAARVEALADPGGICVSRIVRDHVLDKLGFTFEALGLQQVKNIARPVEVYRIVPDVEAPKGVRETMPHPSPPASTPPRRMTWLLLTVVALFGVGVAAWSVSHFALRPDAVAPYSLEDRRMTFALLPFQAPTDDKTGARLAAELTDVVFTEQERIPDWLQLASRRSVEETLSRHAAVKDVAARLNVHFLLRGTVTRAASGYTAELLVVDGATERVLNSRSLVVADAVDTPRTREALDSALSDLTFSALEAEVERARSKPAGALDVRDLTFRALSEWHMRKRQQDEKGAYSTATDLLNRALALSPDDGLALRSTAWVNLCDCVEGWSRNVAEQQAIGEAALEKFLRKNPESPSMLTLKSHLYALRGRFEESLLIDEAVLKRHPTFTNAQYVKAYSLLKLGRPAEALVAINAILDVRDRRGYESALAAAIHYQLEQYDVAVQLAQTAKTRMTREDLGNPKIGAVGLTLVAAEGRLGRLPRAHSALADFKAAVPGVDTISAMKKWMHPAADLAGYEPLFAGLRLAGVGE